MSEIILTCEGTSYNGFNSISLSYALNNIPSSFSCVFPYPMQGQKLPKPKQKYQISIDGVVVQKGTIIVFKVRRDPSGNNIAIFYGEDDSRLLIIDSVGVQPITENITLQALCNNLTSKTKVKIKYTGSPITFKRIKLDPLDSVYTAIKRSIKDFGLFLYSDGLTCNIMQEGSGGTINGTIVDTTGEGTILSSELTFDYSNSISNFTANTYNYTEQISSTLSRSDVSFGNQTYYNVNELLPLETINIGLQTDINRNRALERRYRVVIPTHKIANELPMPNKYVFVKDDYCDINGVMLIYSILFTKGNGLDTTQLELVPVGSYTNAKMLSPQARQLKFGAKFI